MDSNDEKVSDRYLIGVDPMIFVISAFSAQNVFIRPLTFPINLILSAQYGFMIRVFIYSCPDRSPLNGVFLYICYHEQVHHAYFIRSLRLMNTLMIFKNMCTP